MCLVWVCTSERHPITSSFFLRRLNTLPIPNILPPTTASTKGGLDGGWRDRLTMCFVMSLCNQRCLCVGDSFSTSWITIGTIGTIGKENVQYWVFTFYTYFCITVACMPEFILCITINIWMCATKCFFRDFSYDCCIPFSCTKHTYSPFPLPFPFTCLHFVSLLRHHLLSWPPFETGT